MPTGHSQGYPAQRPWNFGRGRIWVAMICGFAAGSVVTAQWVHLEEARAKSNRVFELNVYHAVPGKVPALESRFRGATKLFAKHNLDVVAYWVPENDPAWKNDPVWANTFVYVVAHPNWEEAQKRWDAFHEDPDFQVDLRSEREVKLIEKVDEIHMRPTDFSPMK